MTGAPPVRLVLHYRQRSFAIELPALPATGTIRDFIRELLARNGEQGPPGLLTVRCDGLLLDVGLTFTQAIPGVEHRTLVELVLAVAGPPVTARAREEGEPTRDDSPTDYSESEVAFGLTLDDDGGDLAADRCRADIFEDSCFDAPALDDESASDAADSDLEGSDFEASLDEDAMVDEESGSQVVALDDEEEADEDAAATVLSRPRKAMAAMTYEEEDEEEAPAPIRKKGKTKKKKTTTRHATVRYYSRMNPERSYPLQVILSRQEIEAIVHKGVAEARSKVEVDRDAPLEVEPILPGCECHPPREAVPVDTDEDDEQPPQQLTFWVVPHLFGPVNGARIILRQKGKVISEIPLSIRVANPALVTLFGLGALVLPFLSALLKHLKLDFESQLETGFAPYMSLLDWMVLSLRPEWVALPLLVLTVAAFFWVLPRRKDALWDFKVKQPPRLRGFGLRVADALQAGLRSGKSAGLIGAAAGLAVGAALFGVLAWQSAPGGSLGRAGFLLLGGVPLAGLLAGGLVGLVVGFVDEWKEEEATAATS